MFWNHRVIKRTYPKYEDEVEYGIYEVHYDETNAPESCTMDPIGIVGEDVDELRSTLERMLACLAQPVLDYESFGSEQESAASCNDAHQSIVVSNEGQNPK